MSEHRPPGIALIVEAEADARTAQRLIDRCACEIDWVDEGDLEHLRAWSRRPGKDLGPVGAGGAAFIWLTAPCKGAISQVVLVRCASVASLISLWEDVA